MKIKYFLLLAILFSTGSFSWGQNVMVMSVEASVQGKFKSEAKFGSKYADKVELVGFVFDVQSARDVATGQSTGRRAYQPITVWKANGESSPQFLKALFTNEPIKRITIEFHKTDASLGGISLAYTVVLENAFITGFRESYGPLGNNEKLAAPSNSMLYDEIRIVFEKITVSEVKGKATAEDNWSTNR